MSQKDSDIPELIALQDAARIFKVHPSTLKV